MKKVLLFFFTVCLFWATCSLLALAEGTPPPANLALNKPIVASSEGGANYTVTKAVDGLDTSYWVSAPGAYPATLTVDLGAIQKVTKVVLKLKPNWAAARTQPISILGSVDGATFTELKAAAAYKFEPANMNIVSIGFTATDVRYVRLSIAANSEAPSAQMAEFEVYN